VIESFSAKSLAIPFRESFKHASAARSVTQAVWITATGEGITGCGEGCPREYVTGESLDTAQAFVAAHSADWCKVIRDVSDLRHWVRSHTAEIDANPAAWAAVELAILDLFARRRNVAIEALLDLPPLAGRFTYTAVLGDAPPEVFGAQLRRYGQSGFRSFKIKLAGDAERDAAKVQLLQAAGIAPALVRADANNLWPDAEVAAASLRALQFRFFALEEPLRSGDYAGMARLAGLLDCAIILDESVARPAQLDSLSGPAEHWIANIRVSKMGGLVRSLEFLAEARRRGVRVIVGAHVGETSVLTRAGLTVAAAAADRLVAQEGAFGTHLLAHDVAEPPLMFGAGGIVDADALALAQRPGWGLGPLSIPEG
jgi:L-Ala-D/L-Glu epimerase